MLAVLSPGLWGLCMAFAFRALGGCIDRQTPALNADRITGPECSPPESGWSGRRDSNPRSKAWKAPDTARVRARIPPRIAYTARGCNLNAPRVYLANQRLPRNQR